jgi:hypothetical protein
MNHLYTNKSKSSTSKIDSDFFERHPGRRYRTRLATPDEIAEYRRLGNLPTSPEDWSYFVAVHRATPGIRFRVIFSTPDNARYTASSEAIAQDAFQFVLALRECAGEC